MCRLPPGYEMCVCVCVCDGAAGVCVRAPSAAEIGRTQGNLRDTVVNNDRDTLWVNVEIVRHCA
jgi:hypothetical protein